jgi:hypothetical protein
MDLRSIAENFLCKIQYRRFLLHHASSQEQNFVSAAVITILKQPVFGFIVHIWRILERGPIPQSPVLRVRTLNNTMVIDTLECNGLFPHQLGPHTLISNLVNHSSENEIPGLT